LIVPVEAVIVEVGMALNPVEVTEEVEQPPGFVEVSDVKTSGAVTKFTPNWVGKVIATAEAVVKRPPVVVDIVPEAIVPETVRIPLL
jgi:hypothetical protein